MGKKRCATGYNLYIKDCYEKNGDFKGCITSGEWKGLSDKEKAKWNDIAARQCDK